jgi:hypothetical protein
MGIGTRISGPLRSAVQASFRKRCWRKAWRPSGPQSSSSRRSNRKSGRNRTLPRRPYPDPEAGRWWEGLLSPGIDFAPLSHPLSEWRVIRPELPRRTSGAFAGANVIDQQEWRGLHGRTERPFPVPLFSNSRFRQRIALGPALCYSSHQMAKAAPTVVLWRYS